MTVVSRAAIVRFLRLYGTPAEIEAAGTELPEQVDIDYHSAILDSWGIDPAKLMLTAAGTFDTDPSLSPGVDRNPPKAPPRSDQDVQDPTVGRPISGLKCTHATTYDPTS